MRKRPSIPLRASGDDSSDETELQLSSDSESLFSHRLNDSTAAVYIDGEINQQLSLYCRRCLLAQVMGLEPVRRVKQLLQEY